MFQGQALHWVLLAALLAGAVGVARSLDLSGAFFGLSADRWFLLSLAVPVLHQIYVWFAWRAELHHTLISRTFGLRAGFRLYAVGFAVLILARPVVVTGLAIADRGSLPLGPVPGALLAAVALVPAVYLIHSIRRYFGFERAFGIDHFDPAARNAPLVRRGIFRFTPNAMYVFGFLALYVPGLLLRSEAALLAAAFQHLYIWVHYLCTERPDMRILYGE